MSNMDQASITPLHTNGNNSFNLVFWQGKMEHIREIKLQWTSLITMYPLNWPLHDQYMTSGFKVTVPSILPVFECCKLGYREWLTAKSKKDSTPVRHIYSINVKVRTQREHLRWRHQETTARKVGVSRFPFRAVQSRWSRHSTVSEAYPWILGEHRMCDVVTLTRVAPPDSRACHETIKLIWIIERLFAVLD